MPSKILTINALLEEAGVASAQTKLVRHSQGKHKIDMFGAWLRRRADFEQYQSIQSKPRFDGVKYIVSFVANNMYDTVFVGVYAIQGRLDTPAGGLERLTGDIIQQHYNVYDLVLAGALAEYQGRLLVEWGGGAIAWVQSGANPKPIVELRRNVSEPPFPGYQRFTTELEAVPSLPLEWRGALEQVRGAYLLTHKASGQLYVGSAYGEVGFYGRWCKHATDPDPIELRKVKAADLTVSILEVTDVTWGKEEALKAEVHWKRLLRPALNAN
jgi:hypothetical protein